MKKAFLGLFAAVLAIGCSSDEGNDAEQQQDKVLVSKITQIIHDEDFPETSVADFIYEGDNLIRFGSADRYTELTYSGDKITATKYYVNGELDNENSFNYNGDKLQDVTSTEGERTIFTCIGANIGQTKAQYFDEDVWVTADTRNYQYSNGNVTQMSVVYDFGGGFSGDYRYTFSSDSKNNPFRDMNVYLKALLPVEGLLPMSKNNALTSQYYATSTATTPVATYTYEITYNAENFPTSIKRKTASGEVITETLFEYL